MSGIPLRRYQEEMRKVIFPSNNQADRSPLWPKGLPSRLGVYRNNTLSNWRDSLEQNFPLTKKQFSPAIWQRVRADYFTAFPARHWELNESMVPFPKFIASQHVPPYVKELADYEHYDTQVFIDRAVVRKGLGMTNPTAVVRVYQHQIFYWVAAKANRKKPPVNEPEVLVFYRDSYNMINICEGDPLMLLMMDHFRKPQATLSALEPVRKKLLPTNNVPLAKIHSILRASDLIL